MSAEIQPLTQSGVTQALQILQPELNKQKNIEIAASVLVVAWAISTVALIVFGSLFFGGGIVPLSALIGSAVPCGVITLLTSVLIAIEYSRLYKYPRVGMENCIHILKNKDFQPYMDFQNSIAAKSFTDKKSLQNLLKASELFIELHKKEILEKGLKNNLAAIPDANSNARTEQGDNE